MRRCTGALVGALTFLTMAVVYMLGYDAGRQSMPVSMEPRCEIVMERGKVVKLTCPDSAGRMP
jgi:hypothetical protein